MASAQTISASLELVNSKKNSLRTAISLLGLEWKDLDKHLDLTEKRFHESLTELESREKNLESVRESVLESNKELDLIRKSIESRARELEIKEEKFLLFHQELILQEKQLDKIRRSADERINEAELREKRLSDVQKSMEGLLEKFEVEKEHFETIQMPIGERMKEIKAKDKYVEERSKEVDSMQNWIKAQVKEFSKALELKDQQLESVPKSNEEHCKVPELKSKEGQGPSKRRRVERELVMREEAHNKVAKSRSTKAARQRLISPSGEPTDPPEPWMPSFEAYGVRVMSHERLGTNAAHILAMGQAVCLPADMEHHRKTSQTSLVLSSMKKAMEKMMEMCDQVYQANLEQDELKKDYSLKEAELKGALQQLKEANAELALKLEKAGESTYLTRQPVTSSSCSSSSRSSTSR